MNISSSFLVAALAVVVGLWLFIIAVSILLGSAAAKYLFIDRHHCELGLTCDGQGRRNAAQAARRSRLPRPRRHLWH